MQGFLIGRMTRAFGAKNLILAGSFSSLAGLLTIAGAHTGLCLVGGISLLALRPRPDDPVLSSLASEYAGAARQGVILGFAQSAGGLARTVGPIGGGILYARIAPAAAFIGGAVAALGAMGIALGLRTDEGPDEGAENARPERPDSR